MSPPTQDMASHTGNKFFIYNIPKIYRKVGNMCNLARKYIQSRNIKPNKKYIYIVKAYIFFPHIIWFVCCIFFWRIHFPCTHIFVDAYILCLYILFGFIFLDCIYFLVKLHIFPTFLYIFGMLYINICCRYGLPYKDDV